MQSSQVKYISLLSIPIRKTTDFPSTTNLAVLPRTPHMAGALVHRAGLLNLAVTHSNPITAHLKKPIVSFWKKKRPSGSVRTTKIMLQSAYFIASKLKILPEPLEAILREFGGGNGGGGEPLLSDLPKAAITGEPKPVYVGGDYRRQADAEMTHFALAFEVPGGWMSEKDSMTLTVLQMLMGGGGSFSAGGPGKGMYSRLYLRVLNQYPQMHAFSAFSSIYNNTGLFGIQATTTSEFGPQAVDVAVKELIAVANPGEVDQVQLNRAKQATKSAILMNLESRMVASEDIGRQLLTYGERKPVEHFLKAIDAVSAKDIASVVQKLISSPLTMASYGDVLSLPSYDAVSSRFHSK